MRQLNAELESKVIEEPGNCIKAMRTGNGKHRTTGGRNRLNNSTTNWKTEFLIGPATCVK